MKLLLLKLRFVLGVGWDWKTRWDLRSQSYEERQATKKGRKSYAFWQFPKSRNTKKYEKSDSLFFVLLFGFVLFCSLDWRAFESIEKNIKRQVSLRKNLTPFTVWDSAHLITTRTGNLRTWNGAKKSNLELPSLHY